MGKMESSSSLTHLFPWKNIFLFHSFRSNDDNAVQYDPCMPSAAVHKEILGDSVQHSVVHQLDHSVILTICKCTVWALQLLIFILEVYEMLWAQEDVVILTIITIILKY